MSRKNARDAAMRMLYAADMGGVADAEKMPFDCDTQMGSLDEADRSYIASVHAGYASRRDEIDQKIESMSNGWKIVRMGRVDLAILRLAVFELFYGENVPKSVVIDEAVRLAKKYGADKSSVFINGVLGGVVRAHPDEN